MNPIATPGLARWARRVAAAITSQRSARKALALLGGTLVLALGPVSGTAAFWTGSVNLQPGGLTAGSVTADLGGFTGLDHTFTKDALSTTSYATIANTGTSTANYTVSFALGAGSSTTLASKVKVDLWLEASASACTATARVGAYGWSGTWATSPVFTGSLPGGATGIVCIRSRMAADQLSTTGTVTPRVNIDLVIPGTTWASSDSVSATQRVAAPGVLGNDYTDAVYADGATHYWRLGESSGSILYDWAGTDDAYASAGLIRGTTGAVALGPDTATTFSGTASAGTRTPIPAPQTFAIEAWFKTTTTTGGKIIGFGDASSGISQNHDRHIYMDAAGLVHFGVWPGTASIISTATPYNDGQWHHVVGNLSPAGQQFYIDGALVGGKATTTGWNYTGYWRIGGDNKWAGDEYFDGAIDDVAVYGAPLSGTQVANHYNISGSGPFPAGVGDPYGSTVYADSPTLFWRFGESGGTTAADSGAAGNAGTYYGSVSKPARSAVPGTRDTAASFNGTNGVVTSNTMFTNPQVYSLELWFNTTSTTGGKLIGFGDAQTGSSSSHDRHIYLQNDGRIRYGIYPGSARTVISPAAYNDGKWHHVVATQSSNGMLLYVDGTAVAWDSQSTTPEIYNGYWRVGGDSIGTAWTGAPATTYVTSTIDEVAVYGTALSEAQIKEHYAVATGAPIAAYTSTGSGLTVSFDGSGSRDLDGSITAYSWDFGDGSAPGTGVTTSHAYAATGYYIAGLTVTDNTGTTSTSYYLVYARDITPPSTPGTPTVTVNTGGTVRIAWTGSTDNVGVTGYDVYRNGVKIARSTDTMHTDGTVAVNTAYTYTVRAVDGTGNQSAASGSVSVTTLPVDTAAWYQIKTYSPGKCLTFTSTANSTPLTQYGCGAYAANNQNFRFEAVSGGYYRVALRAAPASVWDLPSSSTTDGADIQLFTAHSAANQQWLPTRLADGSYMFTVRASGKCLDMSGGSWNDGTVIQQWSCNSTNTNQLFTLVKVP